MPGRMRHGHGESLYDSGNAYRGSWANDKRAGVGRFEFACGDVYEGQWADGRYHGRGKYWSPSGAGDEYEGEWRADRPHGHGRYLWRSSGEVYEGEWQDGMRDGKGKVILADGTVLEGHFECGEITNLALSNASFSTGIDERGRRIRMFTATLTCERATRANLASCVYDGETAPAAELPVGAVLSAFARMQMPGRMRHGSGRIRYECGNVYTGQWQHDRRAGAGTYWYACGDAYEGEWRDGMYHGHGKYTGSEVGGGGDSYEGEWREDQPHGAGRYLFRSSGAVYDGQWREGAYHGKGTYTKGDGTATEGMWRDGLLIPLWQR